MPQLSGSIPIASESPSIMEALQKKIRELEKEAATQRHMELMQRRFDQQEAVRKMEQLALKIEMDRREAQTRSDKLEAKSEMEMMKRDAQARSDKLEAEMDKRDIQTKVEIPCWGYAIGC